MMPSSVSAFCTWHTLRSGRIRITCRPLPCAWLSHAPRPVVTPATTMAAPSPWPSRVVGDPVVRRHHTSEADVGAPFIPLLDLPGQCPSLRRCIGLRFMPMHRGGGGYGSPKTAQTLLPSGGHFHHWGLGFKHYSLH